MAAMGEGVSGMSGSAMGGLPWTGTELVWLGATLVMWALIMGVCALAYVTSGS